MISDTLSLRKQYGKMSLVDSSVVRSFEHASSCEACGSTKPEHLFPVAGGGWSGMVGSTCMSILTSGKNPNVDNALLGTGETYQDGDKVMVYPTVEWMTKLGDMLFVVGSHVNRFGDTVTSDYSTNYNGAYRTSKYNPFLDSVYQQARKNGKISIKQFDAVNKSL